ncbi:50S ribosomal protein L7ae [Cohnella xylanilytica]|uniref:Ribosomal L7Ae/L30e/S12e/Gadd45 family protein n=1 Tax=Cohnella xylanilytica TaxID=557555 RepID=A0A841TXF6_9BACL|nr:ribosomal L7Ae/L30e/S12e/Gadd45 family protein [Cohnella xylanilytica]MBB6690823.1 ribosomal L7Ae/L30e/S12e/Gadd45 family protein [Cohnella xylanilytica]GIO10902.1 50S ribosomal protein L7ae [Cohnella xylanilytica]
MTTTNKALSRLGLAMRAGKLVSGEELVLKAIRSGEAKLVLLAEDASEGTRKKVADKCGSYGVELLIGFTRFELGGAAGKPERVLFAVTDRGFADMIRSGWVQHSEVENIE